MSLHEYNAKNAQFRILPRYKVKSEGEIVSTIKAGSHSLGKVNDVKGFRSCFLSPLCNQPTHSESDNALYRRTTLTELNLFISNGKQDIKSESILLSITYVLLQAFPCLIHCKMFGVFFLKFYKNNVLIHLRFNCSTKLFLRV